MAANVTDNFNPEYVPKPIWEDIFSRLSPTDIRAAALSCRLFAVIYRDLHPLQTESRREALAGMQKEIRVFSTQVANTCPIQNLPTYMIRYNGSNTFELFHGNDPDEVKMKFVLRAEQPIEHFIARLCLNNRKLVIGYEFDCQIGMAVFNWEDQKYEKDHQINTIDMRFHGDTLMIVTSEELISFEPNGSHFTKRLPVTACMPSEVIFHPRKPYLLIINKAQLFALLWNYETGNKIALNHPSEIPPKKREKRGSFSIAGCDFFESKVFLSWSTYNSENPKLTYEAYYDLSNSDSKDKLESPHKFILRNKTYKAVKVVSEKYLLRMGRDGIVECDTIKDRIRLWSIKVKTFDFDIGRTYSLKLLNFPLDDPHVIIKESRYKIILNVATGEMTKIDEHRKMICMVHSEKGPCFFFLRQSGGGVCFS